METAERTQILSEAAIDDLVYWKEKIGAIGTVDRVKSPHLGLVMMRAKESVEKQVFNVGELLITECTVTVDGTLGFGALLGNEADKVEVMAIVDAIYHCRDPKWVELKDEFENWLTVEAKRQHQEKVIQFRLMEKSRVDFEVMDE